MSGRAVLGSEKMVCVELKKQALDEQMNVRCPSSKEKHPRHPGNFNFDKTMMG